MRIPKSASGITLDWLRRALPWGRPGCEPVSVQIEPDFGGPSLLGRLARVNLGYATPGCGPASIIVKFQVRDSDREAHIYRLLSEAHVRAVPQMYGAFDYGTLALEDLSPAKAGLQTEGCTVQQARDVLALLADIHGRFWGDARIPPMPPEQFAVAITYNMARCWGTFQNRYYSALGDTAAAFEWMWRNAGIVAAHRLSEPSTLFHGDVHAENLLFGAEPGRGPVLIDWQLAGRGLAANDVSFFLVKSLTTEARRSNEETLLRAYYTALPPQTRAGYGFDHFLLDYRACVTRSMVSAVMLVGPRFADRPDHLDLADTLASRVIAAVQDLNPVGAYRELGRSRDEAPDADFR